MRRVACLCVLGLGVVGLACGDDIKPPGRGRVVDEVEVALGDEGRIAVLAARRGPIEVEIPAQRGRGTVSLRAEEVPRRGGPQPKGELVLHVATQEVSFEPPARMRQEVPAPPPGRGYAAIFSPTGGDAWLAGPPARRGRFVAAGNGGVEEGDAGVTGAGQALTARAKRRELAAEGAGQELGVAAAGQGLPAKAAGHGLPAEAAGHGLPAEAAGHGLPAEAAGQGLPVVRDRWAALGDGTGRNDGMALEDATAEVWEIDVTGSGLWGLALVEIDAGVLRDGSADGRGGPDAGSDAAAEAGAGEAGIWRDAGMVDAGAGDVAVPTDPRWSDAGARDVAVLPDARPEGGADAAGSDARWTDVAPADSGVVILPVDAGVTTLADAAGAEAGAIDAASDPAWDAAIVAAADAAAADVAAVDVAAVDAAVVDAAVDVAPSIEAGAEVGADLRPLLSALGDPCTVGNTCASGICVEGVCCDSGCGGVCRSCALAGSAGKCMPVPAGKDPFEQCSTEVPASCGQTGACDGDGACQLYPAGLMCRSGSCSGGVATGAAFCDGLGTCAGGAPRNCAPYVCGSSSCLGSCTTSADCVAGYVCLKGACGPACDPAVTCSGHGNCTTEGGCACDPGWTGPDCSTPLLTPDAGAADAPITGTDAGTDAATSTTTETATLTGTGTGTTTSTTTETVTLTGTGTTTGMTADAGT